MPKISKAAAAMMHQRGYISTPEMAEALGLAPSAVRRLVAAGTVPSIKGGRMNYVHVTHAVAYFAGDPPSDESVAIARERLVKVVGLATVIAGSAPLPAGSSIDLAVEIEDDGE
jgi:hypothetical protein